MILYILPSWWPYLAITIFPFILVKKGRELTHETINHEHIHLVQQAEMFIIPFYIIYVLEWIVHLLITGNSRAAYYRISFEREAHNNDKNYQYLSCRTPYEWVLYLFNHPGQ